MDRRAFLCRSGAALAAVALPAGAAARGTTALVLGGGGCRGFGHIGVLRVLERERLKPDLVVGSSVGSLIGALWAAGRNAEALEKLGDGMTSNTLRSWVFPGGLGFFNASRIRHFVNEKAGIQTFGALPMRFAAIATELRTGAMAILDRGELGLAVQASSSLPGILEPVRINEHIYVDGNLSAPVPVDAARQLGASRIVAVDVTAPPEHADLNDPFDALYQAFSILTRRLALQERARAELALEPPIPKHNDMEPETVKALIAAGEAVATQALPQLRAVFRRG